MRKKGGIKMNQCQINNCNNKTNMKINIFKINGCTIRKIWVCEECYKKRE